MAASDLVCVHLAAPPGFDGRSAPGRGARRGAMRPDEALPLRAEKPCDLVTCTEAKPGGAKYLAPGLPRLIGKQRANPVAGEESSEAGGWRLRRVGRGEARGPDINRRENPVEIGNIDDVEGATGEVRCEIAGLLINQVRAVHEAMVAVAEDTE